MAQGGRSAWRSYQPLSYCSGTLTSERPIQRIHAVSGSAAGASLMCYLGFVLLGLVSPLVLVSLSSTLPPLSTHFLKYSR